MTVKNISKNPIHGIHPGEVGELPKNRESRIKQYEKLGMLELVKTEEVKQKKTEETVTTKPARGRAKATDKKTEDE